MVCTAVLHAGRMEQCLVDPGELEYCLDPQQGGGVVLSVTIKTILSEILLIERPSLKVRDNASIPKQ